MKAQAKEPATLGPADIIIRGTIEARLVPGVGRSLDVPTNVAFQIPAPPGYVHGARRIALNAEGTAYTFEIELHRMPQAKPWPGYTIDDDHSE